MNIEKLITPQEIRNEWFVSARQIYELTPKKVNYGVWITEIINRLKWSSRVDFVKIHFGYSQKGIEMFNHLLPIENAIKALPQRKKRPEVDLVKEYLETLLAKQRGNLVPVAEPKPRPIEDVINITEQDGEILISGRELHEFLGIGTRYNDWFNRMLEYGFVEGQDFVLVTQKRVSNNPKNPWTTITDHAMKIDMAKEISMIQRNEKGKEARQYFIKCEKKLREVVQTGRALPEDYEEAVEALLGQIRETKKLQLEVKAKEETIQVMQPKVSYHDEVLQREDLITTTDIAKDLGMSAKALNEFLMEQRVLYRRKPKDPLKPYANYQWLITDGYADYKIYSVENFKQNLQWTEKGRQFIIELLEKTQQ